jgi:hypothetical protein
MVLIIPIFFVVMMFLIAPRLASAIILAPIIGTFSGMFFWCLAALCTQSVHSFDSFIKFIIVTIGLTVFAFLSGD